MLDHSVQEAVERSVARFSARSWWELAPGYKAKVIYEELRRLDAEAAAYTKAPSPGMGSKRD
jgi:hypothetical protein